MVFTRNSILKSKILYADSVGFKKLIKGLAKLEVRQLTGASQNTTLRDEDCKANKNIVLP